jgi:serine phosphatase RsbU (regulator of sigma subunit)
VRADGIELLTAPSATTPLGLDPCPAPQATILAPGDRVLLYTDGLVEARSVSGRMLALDHLAGTLRRPDLDDALGELVRMVQNLVRGPVADDLALLLAEYRGPGPTQEAPGPRPKEVARR